MRYISVWLCLLVACASAKTEPPKAAHENTEALMQHLLAEIERPGRQYEIDASKFFERADSLATLIRAYQSSDGAWARWKLLRLARKTRRQDVTEFLISEARKPVAASSSNAVAMSGATAEYANRLEAALGAVDAVSFQGSDEVEEIIRTVELPIARVIGAYLWRQDLLTDSLVSVLHERGLSTEYREMSRSAEQALMSVEPTRWRKEAQP